MYWHIFTSRDLYYKRHPHKLELFILFCLCPNPWCCVWCRVFVLLLDASRVRVWVPVCLVYFRCGSISRVLCTRRELEIWGWWWGMRGQSRRHPVQVLRDLLTVRPILADSDRVWCPGTCRNEIFTRYRPAPRPALSGPHPPSTIS